MNRTLVKLAASGDCISFRTVSMARKSPHTFYVTRNELADLESRRCITVTDLFSFATLSIQDVGGLLNIRITWLSDQGRDAVTGYRENVSVDYAAFADFVTGSLNGGPASLSLLSADEDLRCPFLDFSGAAETLHRVLSMPSLRGKLTRALRDNFKWHGTAAIRFYKDWNPWSFYFEEELSDGRRGICGGLILHENGSLKGAKYALHT